MGPKKAKEVIVAGYNIADMTEEESCASGVLPGENNNGSKFSFVTLQNKRPNDNSWLVSQKLVRKMSYRKSILKRIDKHVVFSSTNLRKIKGYGNW